MFNLCLKFLTFQVTCRNRAVGRSYACELCSKNFPTKRHLHEHNKRKHPQVQQPQIPQQPQEVPQQPHQVPQQQYNNNIPYDNYYYHPVEPFTVKTENAPKTPYPPTTPHPAVMGHDLPLPQISNPVMEEDHNVGSLLRLVYSCPDQLEGQEYAHSPSSQPTQHASQPSHSAMANRPVICPPPEAMMDYPPILDGISLDYL